MFFVSTPVLYKTEVYRNIVAYKRYIIIYLIIIIRYYPLSSHTTFLYLSIYLSRPDQVLDTHRGDGESDGGGGVGGDAEGLHVGGDAGDHLEVGERHVDASLRQGDHGHHIRVVVCRRDNITLTTIMSNVI